jgi:hypothetical protein
MLPLMPKLGFGVSDARLIFLSTRVNTKKTLTIGGHSHVAAVPIVVIIRLVRAPSAESALPIIPLTVVTMIDQSTGVAGTRSAERVASVV